MTAVKKPTLESARKTHNAPIFGRPEELGPEMGRFANVTQMIFHPTEANPTAPNAGVLTYEPGGGFPLHMHDFAQVWYVLEGECQFGDRTLTPGDMVYMEDPHFEYDMHTANGCRILFVQYPGPTTGGRPIYDGRFNKTEKPNVEEENLAQ
ncbi:MAG: cupin domain-containing protein [Alphaproteobacteria bacterium]|nr:cupin domain-containing protein [Alphaproteobacteria bacterium]